MKKIWIGTSGYSYRHWSDGVFYPEGLSDKERLAYYAGHFPTVELNVTFYRLPNQPTFRHWRDHTPHGFRFFIKGSRYITHIKRLNDPQKPLAVFFRTSALLFPKTAGVLWQLPPRFKADPQRLEAFLKALARYPQCKRNVFEFRDPTWFVPEITALIKKHRASFCFADGPAMEGAEVPDVARWVYIRRHGPRRYAGSYSDADIDRDAAAIRRWVLKGKTVFVYFNNDTAGAAPKDAKRLEARLHKMNGFSQSKTRVRA